MSRAKIPQLVAPAIARDNGAHCVFGARWISQRELPMKRKAAASLSVFACVLMLLIPASARAQQAPPPAMQANPTPGCLATPAQLEANKKAAMDFFRTSGAERVALADPSYKQHNPQFVKRAAQNYENDYDEFKSAFLAQTGRGPGGRGAGPGGQAAPAAQPPPGNPFEIVTAECDIVTIVHKRYVQDPNEAPGTFYEAFSFDTFRVKDGKLTEHWDNAMINPPPPAAGPGRGQ
jgi:predicted SnoaL-like aldol condensation-catalyzing enzyme